MRNLFLSGLVVLASALPAFAQVGGSTGLSGGLSSGGLGGGLSGSSLGGSGVLGGTGSFLGGSSIGGTTLGSVGGSGSSGSFLGATSGSTTTRSGTSGSQTVGSTTFLGPYFGNPLSVGIAYSTANSNDTPTFGVPLYTITGVGGTGSSTYGGLAGASGTGGSAVTATPSFSATSVGVRRAPAYTTTLAFTYQPEPPSRVQADLQQAFARSQRLANRNNIRVDMDGPTIVLRGTVADDHERRLAEAMARLTPGVRDLRNELNVRAGPAAPAP
jgi:BON domain